MRILLLCLSLLLTASPVAAQETLGLAAPPELEESGLLGYLLPRFSLKTSVRMRPDPQGPAVLADAPPGEPVFQGGGRIYYLRTANDPRAERFADWLASETGRRTVESFEADGKRPFTAEIASAEEDTGPVFEGDARLGADLSLRHCGRCHVVGEVNRSKSIGSTPSFGVLRALSDWDLRFQQFFVLAPHGAFTQIEGVTPPFDPAFPPPIVPVSLSLDDLDAILAFVAGIAAADLGAPLHLQ